MRSPDDNRGYGPDARMASKSRVLAELQKYMRQKLAGELQDRHAPKPAVAAVAELSGEGDDVDLGGLDESQLGQLLGDSGNEPSE